MPYVIYRIVNTVNSKLYIGVTHNELERRWKEHLYAVHSSEYSHRPLYMAMREYGIDRFSIEQIEECPDERAMYRRELELIKTLVTVYPHGYNLRGKQFGEAEAAIVKFNVCGWTAKQYAEVFGLSVASIRYLKSRYSTFQYVTRDHIPVNVEEIINHAIALRDIS